MSDDPYSTDVSLINDQTPPNRAFLIYCNSIIGRLAVSTTIPLGVNTYIFNFIQNLTERFNSANNDQKSRLIIIARDINEFVSNFAVIVNNDNDNIVDIDINEDNSNIVFNIFRRNAQQHPSG